MSQLDLPLRLQDHAVFETFWPAGNEALTGLLEDLCERSNGPGCWIWGKPATGKSHLLQAVCARNGNRSVFLPLATVCEAGPGILEGMAERAFVCIDDVHLVAGNDDWEQGLFRLFESAVQNQAVLVLSANAPLRETGIALPDLQSRFSLLPAFKVSALAENEKHNALKHRANYRGLELPDETARFLVNHNRRDMATLYGVLDRLAAEAMTAQRRLTIPFVKSVM